MDWEAWRATVHGVTKSQTQLSDWTDVEPRHRSEEHNQAGANDFQCLTWIFWVCQLSPKRYNDLLLSMSQFDHYQLQLVYPNIVATSSKKSPAQNFANHFLTHSISHTTFSLYYISFFFFLAFQLHLTFLEVIKHNTLKCYYYLPLSLKCYTKLQQFW